MWYYLYKMCEINAVDVSINQRIKMIRKALKLNQRDFSTYMSLSKSYIGGVETGIRQVNGRLIKLIVSEFSVNEEWLKTGVGEMFTQNSDEKFTRLLSIFKELPSKYQEFVLKMIETLRKLDGA
ncbi:hypothetical protein AGMMS50212_12420 [Spirochaetia bacterium]|nr:hypothetical protein AGMMS50212_12420 [Spirochaetia bacterium]